MQIDLPKLKLTTVPIRPVYSCYLPPDPSINMLFSQDTADYSQSRFEAFCDLYELPYDDSHAEEWYDDEPMGFSTPLPSRPFGNDQTSCPPLTASPALSRSSEPGTGPMAVPERVKSPTGLGLGRPPLGDWKKK